MFANNKLTKLLIFVLLFSSITYSIYYFSCDIKSPINGVKVILNTKPINTIISGMIVNSATNEPLTGRRVTLTIEGQNKTNIVDLTAEPQSEFITNQGMVSFAITNDFVPSETSPAKLVLVAKADGFLPTSMPLDIYEVGDAQFTIHMIEINNPPNGAATAKGTGTTNGSGAVINNDLVVTATEPTTSAFASIKVPVGTIITDKYGNALTGTITATIVYCTNQTEESLLAFPGGFSVTINKDGVLSDAVFFTGGFASIEIKDQSGRIAKTFSTPVDVTMQIPPETGNPETEAKVKDGDEVDIWSYNIETSIWDHEKRGTISGPDVNGNYTANFQTNHLTYWNLDWTYSAWCSQSSKINIKGKCYYNQPLFMKLEAYDNIYKSSFIRTRTILDDWIIFTDNVPIGIKVRISAYNDYANTILIGSLVVDDLCAPGDLTMEIDQICSDLKTEVILHCEGWCTCNPNLIIRPNGNPIWYRLMDQPNSFWLYAGETENGKITIPGILIDRVYHYGTWYEETYKPDQPEETGWYEIEGQIFPNLKAEVKAVSHNVDSVYTYWAKEWNKPVLYFREQLPPSICEELCSEAK